MESKPLKISQKHYGVPQIACEAEIAIAPTAEPLTYSNSARVSALGVSASMIANIGCPHVLLANYTPAVVPLPVSADNAGRLIQFDGEKKA